MNRARTTKVTSYLLFRILLVWGILGCVWVAAQEEENPDTPTFSQAEIEAAFDTCRERAKAEAETLQRFPIRLELMGETFSERLELCVLSVLHGEELMATPLG